MKYGFLFGAGAEVGYGLPSGGKFALNIFRFDASDSKKEFKLMRSSVDQHTNYACQWLDPVQKKLTHFSQGIC